MEGSANKFLNKRIPRCEYLRLLRLGAGLTQNQVAELLQVSRSTYTYYEVGKTVLSVDTLETLAQIYHVPAHYILYCIPRSLQNIDFGKLTVRHTKSEGLKNPSEEAIIRLYSRVNHHRE